MNIEEIIKRNYQNLEMFIRDLKLNQTTVNKYNKNLILKENSFVEMTYKCGGIKNEFNTRFVILSNKANNMEELETDTNWGLYVLGTNNYFKVLDNFKIGKINIIVLLNINCSDLEFFKENIISIDDALVNNVKEKMKVDLKRKIIKDLDDGYFYLHTNFPIGIDETGNFIK